MANEFPKERAISRFSKDFAAIKRDLITFAQAYETGSFSDFNESSPGMAQLEFNAYVGDLLFFFLDQAYNETRDATATQLANVQDNAKMRGYKPSGKRAARGQLSWAVEVPASVDSFGNVVPDERYTPVLLKGSQGTANNGTTFETLEDIYFTASLGRAVTGSQFDGSTGLPTMFGLMKSVDVIGGRTVSEDIAVTDFKAFRKLDLSEADVLEVIDVFDTEGNEWHEVDWLAQDWVFSDEVNQNDDADLVPYVLKLQPAPRRFVVDRDIVTGVSRLVFGSGDGLSFDDELVPNVADFALPLAGRRTFSSVSIDPQNFLRTRSLGLSPHGTTLTVRYRVGGGEETNVPALAVAQKSSVNVSFSSTSIDTVTKGRVEASVGCFNAVAMRGGGPPETIQEVKQNAAAHYASQNRMVTREDVVARCFSLPAKFGRLEKAFVKPSLGPFSYDVHVLTTDADGLLTTATATLKSNLALYFQKFRLLTDGINILDATVLDMRVHFGVVVGRGFNRSEVLAACLGELTGYFSLERSQIGQPVVVSDVVATLQAVRGVVSVYNIEFRNVSGQVDGLSYSDDRFDLSNSLRDGMVVCPPEAILYVRHPRRDIVGSAK